MANSVHDGATRIIEAIVEMVDLSLGGATVDAVPVLVARRIGRKRRFRAILFYIFYSFCGYMNSAHWLQFVRLYQLFVPS